MYHPKTVEWDERLKAMLDEVDHALEDRYGGHWRLRRNRPARGETANPEADGLFYVGAVFTPGFGSRLGRGYLIDLSLATDEELPDGKREEIEAYALALLRKLLPERFPERSLQVERDGRLYKIHGELGLGQA